MQHQVGYEINYLCSIYFLHEKISKTFQITFLAPEPKQEKKDEPVIETKASVVVKSEIKPDKTIKEKTNEKTTNEKKKEVKISTIVSVVEEIKPTKTIKSKSGMSGMISIVDTNLHNM